MRTCTHFCILTLSRNAGAGAHERHTRHLDLVLGVQWCWAPSISRWAENLVLLLIQDCAVGVDNMFKAELFELFAIFPAAQAPRCT